MKNKNIVTLFILASILIIPTVHAMIKDPTRLIVVNSTSTPPPDLMLRLNGDKNVYALHGAQLIIDDSSLDKDCNNIGEGIYQCTMTLNKTDVWARMCAIGTFKYDKNDHHYFDVVPQIQYFDDSGVSEAVWLEAFQGNALKVGFKNTTKK